MRFIFLKKLYKKVLLKRIYKLKVKSAQFFQASETAKYSIDEIQRHINIHQKFSAAGDLYSRSYLNCYIDEKLAKIKKYDNEYSISHQRYLNTQDQIARLEEELKNLELSITKRP